MGFFLSHGCSQSLHGGAHTSPYQAPWKGWCQRRRFRWLKLAIPKAAVKFQCAWRRLLARRELAKLKVQWIDTLNRQAVAVQAYLRMKFHRENYLAMRTAAVILQCMYRKWFVAERDWRAALQRRRSILDDREEVGNDDAPTIIGSVVVRRSHVRRYHRYDPATGRTYPRYLRHS